MDSWHLLLLGAALLLSVIRASDLNWGKKVPCFVVEGTVVCPGCRYRAGLTCPRSLKQQSCIPSSTADPYHARRRTKPPEKTASTSSSTSASTSTTESSTTEAVNTTTAAPRLLFGKRLTKNPLDMSIFLYRIMDADQLRRRWKKDTQSGSTELQQGVWVHLEDESQNDQETVQKEEEPETCRWNGDCPCPQICCDMGEGCPKRCVKGIRLPPPFG
ncbi:uncharacterized protein LOC129228665 [Uloborus diversus]|uniref:uncharacterized protein LOC129228665 n=1 Tax=Uloborus diversus TaxID=327109 RepID=UPI0024090066|nr:uncharacterized protein LOC129228665 [Uloborus diversus]